MAEPVVNSSFAPAVMASRTAARFAMVAYMFISFSFCNQQAKHKHYFHHMYQARVAGLSECFVYAARNGLIGQFKGVDMAPVVESWAKSIRKANKPRDAVDEEGYRNRGVLLGSNSNFVWNT